MNIKKYSLYGLIICCIIGLYSFHFSDIPPFRTDEGYFYDGARQVMLGQSVSTPSFDNGQGQSQAYFGHPPLHFLLLGYWFLLFGDSLVALRTYSVFMSSLSVIIIILLTRLFSISRQHMTLLILLLLTNPLFYVMAKTNRPEGLIMLGTGVAIYSYLRWRQTLLQRWIVISGVSIAVTSLAHYYIFFMGAFWLIVLLKHRKFSSLGLFLGCGIAVYLPYMVWLFQNWNIAITQFLARRPLEATSITLKLYDFVITSLNFRSISITCLVIVGFMMLTYTQKLKKTKWVCLIVLLFYAQFLFLPIFTPQHMLPILVVVVVQYCYIFSKKINIFFTRIFLLAIILINFFGTLYFIQKFSSWNYQKYTKHIQSQDFYYLEHSIIGPSYMKEVLKDRSFIAWNTYLDGFIRHYASDQLLIQQIKKCNIILIDNHTINLSNKMQDFLNTHALEIKTIYNGEYGYWPLTLYRMNHSETKNE